MGLGFFSPAGKKERHTVSVQVREEWLALFTGWSVGGGGGDETREEMD